MLIQKCSGYAIHSQTDGLPFAIYTDDGRGNGDCCGEFSTLDCCVKFCTENPFDSDGAAQEADEAAAAYDDYGDFDYSMNA